MSVTIDPREERRIPVEVEIGQAPEGLIIGRPRLSVQNVTAIGPASVLDQVDHARVVVRIDQSGVAVSNQFQLEAVDVRGAVIGPTQGVSLTPETVTVQIDVDARRDDQGGRRSARTVDRHARRGFAIEPVAVDPPTVTLVGTPEALAPITEVPRRPSRSTGLTAAGTLPARARGSRRASRLVVRGRPRSP